MHGRPRHFSLLLTLVITCLFFWQIPKLAVASEMTVDIQTFVDPTRELDFDQVLAMGPAAFQPAQRSDINFGYAQDTVWVRIAIISKSNKDVILSMTPNFVDLIDIYVGTDVSRSFSHLASGDHRPLPADGLSGLDDAIPLSLKANETMLAYVRLAAINSALTTEVLVYPKEERPRRETTSILVAGIWLGGMVILGVIQLVFFYYDRKTRNLLLAIATFMVAAVYLGTLGVSRVLLFPGGGAGNDIFVSVSIWLSLIASTFAAIHILDLKEGNHRLYRVFLAFSAFGAVGVVCGVLGLHLVFTPIGSLASVGLATLAALEGLRTANAGGAGTRLRAAAYAALWAGVAAVMIQRTAVIDLPVWAAHIYAGACLLQTVLLTAALGVRLRAAEAMNLAMQKIALTAAQTAEAQALKLVETRTRELVVARRMAEDALQAELASQQRQVRFMEVISHQYRTPLAVIRTNIDNIGFSLPDGDENNSKQLERIRKAIQRLVEVLEVNLFRARLQGPFFQPILVRTNVADIIKAAAARGRDLLQSQIVTEIAVDPASRIFVDAEMLGLAIVNLLENAVKYSRPKSRVPVVLFCRTEENSVTIAVRDQGIGIPADEIGLAFDPTWRGSNVVGVEGTGTGLSLVARIVAAHSGTVHIASVENEGTTVTIVLPDSERSVASHHFQADVAPEPGK